ncbi:MAG TPA: amidase [Thermaerobacter sp.]
MDELARLGATAQAELVRKKEITPLELVEAAIQRIERLNPRLNAVVTPMYEEARRVASGPLRDGPFTGVPFLLKDLGPAYAGVRMTSGSAFLKDYVPTYDSELVRRLKKAGLIVIGKTNTPEFGLVPTTEPRLFGPARNPWDPDRTTGGSSGGSAAAVAAGFVPMAHANDGGGSIRIPASCCGVFGLKPTRARTPLGPDVGDIMSGLVVEHAVTRSVRDSAALLDAIAGPDVGDPYWAPPRARPYTEEVGADPGRLRIAFTTEPPTGAPVHPDCVRAVEETARLCEELGHHVEEAAPQVDVEQLLPVFTVIWTAGCTAAVNAMARVTGREPGPDDLEPLTRALYEMGKEQTAPAYLEAVWAMQRVARDVARFFLSYDVLLTPTLAEPPLPLGTLAPPPDEPLTAFFRAAAFTPFTPLANLTGQPAMSVPLYWNGQNLPIGVMFTGRFGDEATLFRLAAQLEEARPWADRWPDLVQGASG